MFFVLISIAILLIIIHRSIHLSRRGILINKIPGPKPLPVIGNMLQFLVGPIVLFYTGRKLAGQFKKIVKFWAFNRPIVNVYDPDDIEIVLSSQKHLTKSFIYDFIKPWLNEGLLTSTGEKWHSRRKILTPAFHFNILRQFCNVFAEQSAKTVENLKPETFKSETDVIPHVTTFTLHSICETAMGTNLDSGKSAIGKYKKAIYEMGEHIIYRFSRSWLHSSFIFNLTSAGKKQKETLNTLHTFSRDVIRERRVERNISGNKFEVESMSDDFYVSSKKRLAMLDLMLLAEEDGKIDEAGIREEVDTFMFEGHDTTTMAITFCLMILANHPEIQELIFKELDEVFEGSDRIATIDDYNNLKYLERCIKESLRIYPSVPFISRLITEDLHLKDYTIPAGTSFNLHIFDVHRNPKLFPNPLKFDPDRFLPENVVNRHPFAYIPFSAGPRNCIGQKFAILEVKAILSALMRRYRLEAVTRPDDIIFTADLVLRSVDPIKVKFVLREKK